MKSGLLTPSQWQLHWPSGKLIDTADCLYNILINFIIANILKLQSHIPDFWHGKICEYNTFFCATARNKHDLTAIIARNETEKFEFNKEKMTGRILARNITIIAQ